MKEKKFFDIKSKNNKQKPLEKRMKLLVYCFILVAILMIAILFDFQVLKFDFYAALASDQHEIYQKLFPERGTIYLEDKELSVLTNQDNLYPVALNKDYNLVYAQPKYLESAPEEIAKALAPFLEMSEEELLSRLNKSDDPYEPLKHKVEDSVAENIRNLEIKGIKITKETFRYYPEKNIGSSVYGFVGLTSDNQRKGQYGVEGYFDKELGGLQGEVQSEKDIAGNFISIVDKKFTRAKDGDDIVLTLDKTLQYEICSRFNEHAKVIEADNGTVIVMDPKSGAIIAMCSYPDFDPNNYNQVDDLGVYNNHAVYDAYEIGSIFKPITMAIGLDLDKVTPETTYFDDGLVKIDKFTIRNHDK